MATPNREKQISFSKTTRETKSECAEVGALILVIHQREANRNRRPNAWSAVDFDRAVVIFHDLFRNEKSKAGAALALLGREIGIEDLRDLLGADSWPGVGDAHVDVKFFEDTAHVDRAFGIGRRLDGIDYHVLDSAGNLDSVTHDRTGIIRHIGFEFDAVFFGHGPDAVDDFADDFGNGNVFMGSGLDTAVILPHSQEIAAEPDILLDDFEFLVRAAARPRVVRFFRLLEFLGEKLDIAPNDGEWISNIVHEFRGSLPEIGHLFFLRQLLKQAVVQFLDLAGGSLARSMRAGASNITADDFPHFARIKGFADVVVCAQPDRFLGRFERAESSQHDDREMRIDLPNAAQSFDAGDARHSNIEDDRVRFFFVEQLQADLDGVGGMHLIARLQKHPQTLARAHFVIDNEHLGEIGVGYHCSHR